MIEYVSYDVLSDGNYWARVYILRTNGHERIYNVRRASASRIMWLCSDLEMAGVGMTRPTSLGWYWRRDLSRSNN